MMIEENPMKLETMEMSLNALSGNTGYNTLRIKASVKNRQITVLIDTVIPIILLMRKRPNPWFVTWNQLSI